MVNKVRVNIAGTPYAIATTDPEKYILSLAKKLDEDITKLLDDNANLSVTKAAVFCAMDYLDEYRRFRITLRMPPAQSWRKIRSKQRMRCCGGKLPPCANSWKKCAIRKPGARSAPSRRHSSLLPRAKRTRRNKPFTG